MRTFLRTSLLAPLAAGAALALTASSANADATIKYPRQHPDYVAELEPHFDFAFFHYRYYGPRRLYNDLEFGAGFRASIVVMDPGFVRKINDTVAITFGGDITACPYDSYCYGYTHLRFPVGL